MTKKISIEHARCNLEEIIEDLPWFKKTEKIGVDGKSGIRLQVTDKKEAKKDLLNCATISSKGKKLFYEGFELLLHKFYEPKNKKLTAELSKVYAKKENATTLPKSDWIEEFPSKFPPTIEAAVALLQDEIWNQEWFVSVSSGYFDAGKIISLEEFEKPSKESPRLVVYATDLQKAKDSVAFKDAVRYKGNLGLEEWLEMDNLWHGYEIIILKKKREKKEDPGVGGKALADKVCIPKIMETSDERIWSKINELEFRIKQIEIRIMKNET